MKKIVTNSKEETQEFAKDFAKKLEKGSVICLYGDLGAGKTTFVQGLAEGLGISDRIISPTFVFIRQHGYFYHIDLYRVSSEKEVKELGLSELFSQENIVVIEWAEKMKDLLPKKRIDIYIKQLEGDRREIQFSEV